MKYIYWWWAMFLPLVGIPKGISNAPLQLHRIKGEITIDGKVTEEEWQKIEPLSVVMSSPEFNGPMSEKTEIRIGYDDKYIYLSGILYDSEPDKILFNTKKRDALTPSTEWFGVIIDSFNDKENACAFFTTPTGIRLDAQVLNDGLGRNPINVNWNNFWDAASSRDDKGWYAEIRIPFTSLPIDASTEDIIMGITTWRYIARKNEVHVYPEIPPDYGDMSTWRPSLAREFLLKNVKPSKPFYLTPYALAGHQSVNELNDTETAYDHSESFKRELGLDIKYGINSNWTLDLSLNTDFAQVEVDDQQVNLSRFGLFFPEKRLFFQERAGIFNFALDRLDQIFYSRRIGIDDDGNIQRIYGGARLVGRSGRWDFGLLTMQTANDGDAKGENMTVLRTKSQIINDQSEIGLILTNRMDFDGNYNFVYGLDANFALSKIDFLRIRWAQSIDNEYGNFKMASLDPSILKIWLSNNTNKYLGYGISFSVVGKEFDPELGFLQRENYIRLANRLQYNFAPKSDSPIFRHGPRSGGSLFWTKGTGEIESLFWRLSYNVNMKNAWGFQAGVVNRIDNIDDEFKLTDDVIIPAGDYDFRNFFFEINTPYTEKVYTEINYELGTFYDGNIQTIELNPTWAASASFELTSTYSFNKISFDSRNDHLDIHLLGIKAVYMFNTKLSLSGFVQYNSLDQNFGGNFRFRYNPSEGNDLFIVYNEDLNLERTMKDPALPGFNERQILIKYSYTFNL